MTTLLKNCTLANKLNVNITITDGTITAIGNQTKADKIIDIKGKTVLPGIIDSHVHFREPGGEQKEDWLTGSMAAVAGGVTTVIDMPNNDPPITDLATLNKKRKLTKKSLVNFGFFFGATTNNIEEVRKVSGIAGIKIYVGSSTGNLLVAQDDDIKKLMEIPNINWVIHAEDEELIRKNSQQISENSNSAIHSQIRNRQVAMKGVERVIDLAKETNARIHICHISTAEEVSLIKKAKNANLQITCEVSPHHLFLNDGAYEKFGNFVKVNPPLRTKKDNEALLKGLNDGIIDIIATDHAPHTIKEKETPYHDAPAGIPEVQTSLPLMLNEVNKGTITIEQLIEIMSAQPAKLFSLQNKGLIAEGYDADITVVDMDKKQIINKEMLLSKCGWSPYENMKITGWPVMTFVNGNLVYDQGKINQQFKGREITYGKI
ncbi:dihydroorotase [Patescibacteria group bacterium]|nr:dihydroorotase [Patescibacteria group bacterium]